MSKTDAEITLSFKAEYKQALIAIANMSKALKALQAQANIMLNVGNTGTPDGKAGVVNMNPSEVAKYRDVMLQTGKAVAGVSAELVKYGEALTKSGIPAERVQAVIDLAQSYNTLASSVGAAINALNGLTGAGDGVPPQMSVITEQVKLLQEQVATLQKQLDDIKNTPAPAVPGTPTAPGKSTLDANVRTMTWLQQANAARRLSRAVGELSEKFSTLAEDAANGNLNLTSMVGNIAMLGYAMKGALGPISAVILGVELLQGAWNTYARSAKRAEDAEADVQATMKLSKEAYEAAATAKENYLKQEERKDEIEILKQKYKALNDEIERGLQLIKDTIAAEIARLALIEDEAEHKETLQKAELGRQLMSGKISEEEYQQALINMGQQSKVRKANLAVDKAVAKKKGTDEEWKAARANYAEKARLAGEKEGVLAQYLSEEEIEALQKGKETLEQRRNERRAKLREAQKKQKKQIWGGMGGFDAMELQAEITSLKAELQAADRALLDYETFIEEKIGTDDISGYSARRKHQQEQTDIAINERNQAGEKAEAAMKADEEAARELNSTRKRSAQEIKQADEYAQSELESMRVKAEERKKQAERDKQYRDIQKQLANMTNAEIREAQSYIQAALSNPQSGIDHKTRAQFQRIEALYSDTLSSRKEAGAQTVQEVRNAAKGKKGNEVTRWAESNVEKYATSPLTAKQADKLIQQGTQALRTQSKVDDEMMAAILNQAKVTEQVTTKQREQLRELKLQLQRQNRAMMQNID